MSGLRSERSGEQENAGRWTFLLYVFWSCVTCAVLPALPALSFILVVVWGAVVILAGVIFSPLRLLAMAALNGAVFFWQAGLEGMVSYILLFGLAVYTMGILTSAGRDYYQVRAGGIAAAVLGASLYLGALYVSQEGIGIQELEAELSSAFKQSLASYESKGLLEIYSQQGISKQELETRFQELAGGLARHLPAIYYLQVIVAVFFMLLIASNVSLRRRKERLKRRSYHLEKMPWPLAWLVITGLAGWLWGYNDKNTYYYAGSNILVIMVPITFYYGLAAFIYKLKEMIPAARRWVVFIFIVASMVFLPSAVIFLSLVGLFDSLIDFRKVRFRKEETK